MAVLGGGRWAVDDMSRRVRKDESDFRLQIGSVREDVRQLGLELRELLVPRVPTVTLAELSGEWLPRKLKKLSSSPETFEGRVRLHLLPALGNHSCATLRALDVEDLLDAMVAGGYGEQTANHVRDAGRQLVEFATTNRLWVGPNPFQQAKKLKVPDPEHDVLEREEAARLLRFVAVHWRPLFALAIYLGPRRGTIINIQPADVHLSEGLVDFLVMKDGKPRRSIPVPDELMPHLEAALRTSRGEWLFSQANGKKMCAGSHVLCDELASAMERAEIRRPHGPPRITFHGLRRCSSTLHQEAGCHPWVVSKILGHSQASLAMFGNVVENMTAKRYTQFSERFIRRELNRLSLTNPQNIGTSYDEKRD